MRARIVPAELREVNKYIEAEHRHHGRVQGHRFSMALVDEAGEMRGCAVLGRPTSGLDPKKVLEVTRLCTDGSPNACSMLYTAAARAAKAIGYERIQTYIFKSEDGASLKASGWVYLRDAHPSGRHRARSDGTTRNTEHVDIPKTLWVKDLNPAVATAELKHHRRKA